HLCGIVTIPRPPTPHTLSLHDALPICKAHLSACMKKPYATMKLHLKPYICFYSPPPQRTQQQPSIWVNNSAFALPKNTSSHAVKDRKSTRLNSSHVSISYAVFCLKKKN